jgi:hypothetical protein
MMQDEEQPAAMSAAIEQHDVAEGTVLEIESRVALLGDFSLCPIEHGAAHT